MCMCMCMCMHMRDILVKELASRRSAREPRGGAADVPQRLSTLLGSTHTDMKRTRGSMAVCTSSARAPLTVSLTAPTHTFDRVPHFPNPFTALLLRRKYLLGILWRSHTPHCRAMCRLVCGFCHAHSKASASLFEERPRTTSRMRHGCPAAGAPPPESSPLCWRSRRTGSGARADVRVLRPLSSRRK